MRPKFDKLPDEADALMFDSVTRREMATTRPSSSP